MQKADNISFSAEKEETTERQALSVRLFTSAAEIKKPFFSLSHTNQHAVISEDIVNSSG